MRPMDDCYTHWGASMNYLCAFARFGTPVMVRETGWSGTGLLVGLVQLAAVCTPTANGSAVLDKDRGDGVHGLLACWCGLFSWRRCAAP